MLITKNPAIDTFLRTIQNSRSAGGASNTSVPHPCDFFRHKGGMPSATHHNAGTLVDVSICLSAAAR
jgi:hypothetical protein